MEMEGNDLSLAAIWLYQTISVSLPGEWSVAELNMMQWKYTS